MNRVIFILFSALLLSGCSKSIVVQTEHIKPADLNRLKTFRIIEDNSNTNVAFNEANQERIRLSIVNELNNRNYLESELADFEISILGGVEMVRQTGVRYNYPGAYPYYRPYYPDSNLTPKNSDNSALIINVFDNGQLVWQGVATGNFTPKKKQHIEVVIADIVKSIFNEFPYRSEL
jgi:hypothetical protein